MFVNGKKPLKIRGFYNFSSGEQDLNLRPSGYEPDELPTAPSRDELIYN